MANTSDIRNGLCLKLNHDIYSIIGFQHVKPGKGAAFVRTKIKSLTTGRVLDHTFSAGHKIDTVRVERRKFQYLYNDDMGYHFMDTETYEQIRLQKAMLGSPQFLKESSEVEVLFNTEDDSPLTVEMPQYIIMKITY